MSEDWQEYSRGPQNSGENSPVLRTGVSGQRGPGRKETGTQGHNPMSVTFFLSLLRHPPAPRLSSLWQRCEKERGSYKWTWEKEEVKGGGLLPETVFVDCKMGRNHELLATISMVT